MQPDTQTGFYVLWCLLCTPFGLGIWAGWALRGKWAARGARK
jgi:hypothetical protein